MIGKLGFKSAVSVKDTVAKKIDEYRKKKEDRSPQTSPKDRKIQQATSWGGDSRKSNGDRSTRPEHYISDDDPDGNSFV